jgi:hypothetical protein
MGFFDLGWTAWIIAAVLLGIGAISRSPPGISLADCVVIALAPVAY